jgi:hypothetical protein
MAHKHRTPPDEGGARGNLLGGGLRGFLNRNRLQRQVPIAEVAAALGLEANRALSSAWDLRFGTHGSLSIDPDGGRWFDHEAGRGGGRVELVQHVLGLGGDWRSARAWMAENGFPQYRRTNGSIGRPAAPQRPAPAARPDPEPVAMPDHAARLWEAATDPRGTLAETYLMRRGLHLWEGAADVIRFHPRAPGRPCSPWPVQSIRDCRRRCSARA